MSSLLATSPLVIPTARKADAVAVEQKSVILEDNPDFQASLQKTLGGSFKQDSTLEAAFAKKTSFHHHDHGIFDILFIFLSSVLIPHPFFSNYLSQ